VFLKRFIDVFLVVLSAPVWLPVFLGIAGLVRWNLGSPVFFRQRRPGKGEVIFEIIKFRTMRDLRDRNGKRLPDSERLTPFGRWLRASSLDELPELINVLRGEMSLVGPRPLLPQYLDRYSPAQRRRHLVLPGITGWAQVSGRNAVGWEQRFNMDAWYVENRNLWLDLKILALTVGAVLCRRGISAPGDVTMPEFEGDSRK
jgi:sugar transferase EpsL